MTNLAALLLALPCHISFLSSFLKPQIQSTISTKYGTMQSLAALSTTWVDNQGNDLNPLETADDELKVISYNILGPLHGESSKHFYAPTSITKWTRRRDKLLAVIKSTDADVVCLQEVSFKALKETFIPGLKPMGLKLSSYAGNKFSPTNKFSKGHKQIGCAIFVRDAKIETVVVRSTYLKYVIAFH